ncbi:lipopolysaccharide assembly protein LapB [Aliiglaciecola sp. CAU 1673]|uniref:lipopolysaccharide assembly protein LapB n=1 Tax=Aliiglaciecola sp. CAU 1673 TaxID=3032595 RepID=UPI0023DAD4E3|nr:lipopolysaccharide assembly protein LapB [Aliiglaciecola sp. CAU 1673]MDF2177651.1 lipopolysaccharide assembly protein LapB [Aliiglaciecola sp. CAU 1673]
MLELLFLLLPVAAGYGWVMGRNSVRQAQRKESSILSRHYYKGLNFLLSDQPDKAVDTLIKMINVDSGTVETHIAMGNFFRHRGELDRAIRVHQNLVDKEQLSDSEKQQALKELGRDYLLAGFLERAEAAFLQLLDSDKHFLDAQQQLFSIYQTTKEWDRAIELAERMVDCEGAGPELWERVAHFYCERAAVQLRKQQFEAAEKSLQQAILSDEHAVRPWLMLGEMAIEMQDYRQAQAYLKEVPVRDITWLSEAVPLLEICAEHTNDDEALGELLENYHQQCATAYLAKVKLMAKQGKQEQAAQFLLQQLRKKPTMRGFETLLQLFRAQQDSQQVQECLTMLQELIREQINQRPKYRCTSCGFSGRQIHWLCPSCKKWGAVKPIKGLDGE